MKEYIDRAIERIEYHGVETEHAPDLTDLDVHRVRSYPIPESRPAESTRDEFADGLLRRVAS